MTRNGRKTQKDVSCTTRAQSHWETLGYSEDQVSESSHQKARKLGICSLSSKFCLSLSRSYSLEN
jgi:hypothetical protein